MRYLGPLPAGGSVKADITIREQIVFPLEGRPVLRAYEEFSDLPDGRVVQAYSLAETAVEKVLALADRARNEPRDLYDLWHLVSCEAIELSELVPAMTAKLALTGISVLGFPDPNSIHPTPHSGAGADQNALSDGGPVPADGFFGPSHKNENRQHACFQQFSRHLSRPASFLSRFPPLRADLHPAGSASIRRTMLPNSRRVRWLSANISQ